MKHPHRIIGFYLTELGRAFLEPIFLFLTTLSGCINVIGALCFYAVERDSNVGLRTPFDALYFTVTTITGVGYGDIVPKTIAGKFIAIILMLLGTALFAAFTATLATTLIELELKRKHTEVAAVKIKKH